MNDCLVSFIDGLIDWLIDSPSDMQLTNPLFRLTETCMLKQKTRYLFSKIYGNIVNT